MHRPRDLFRYPSAFVGAVLCLSIAIEPTTVSASSVTPMPVQTLADLSGQVIVGRVASVRSYWADHPRRIESEVRFESVDYLKGRLVPLADAFTLIVPGGKIDQMQMQIADAPRFAVGEKWLLFLLPTYKTFPVAGLHQGAFKIETDATGVERVYGSEGRPVRGIGDDGFLTVQESEPKSTPTRLVETDRLRVRPVQTDARSEGPILSLEEFRQQIAPFLESSRDHQLTEPAGKRVPLTYTPAPFRTANGNAAPAGPARNGPFQRESLATEATNVPPRKPAESDSEARP